MNKYYISTAIAYTSGKPHIGNTYEIVLADAIARFKRMLGFDVYFQTGTDEHGEKIEIKPRKVTIFEINLIEIKENNIRFKVHCSKGTYIRTFCEDIAEKLGTVGYMSSLRRTRVGNFTLEDVGKLVTIEETLKNEPKYELKDKELSKFMNGAKIIVNLKDGLVRVYDNDKFIGVGETKNKVLKRKIVI